MPSLRSIWCLYKASAQGVHNTYARAVAATRSIKGRCLTAAAWRRGRTSALVFVILFFFFLRPECSLSRQRDYHAAEQSNSAEITRWAKYTYSYVSGPPLPFM